MKIGIFGGSFNPVHAGHLRLAEYALSELNLDQLFFVPSSRTPLKDPQKLLPASLRVRQLKRAIRGREKMRVSFCEIDRGGASYTVDTLRYFSRKFGQKAVLYFLSGADTLESLDRWKSVKKVFKMCRFVVASRPGYPLDIKNYPVMAMPFEALDLSSTQIRSRKDFNSRVQKEVFHRNAA